jgi:hypothetical protein
VLTLPRLATADELERVGWAGRDPAGAPVDEAVLDTEREVRARFGVRRDPMVLADWWADFSAERRPAMHR